MSEQSTPDQAAPDQKPHKAGFVSIVGKPNVGKSTLMNILVGERLSIITSKAQTTRHRIMGIISSDDFQIVYSDTPGIIKPRYELQNSMMHFVNTSLEDADIILFVTDLFERFDEEDVIKRLRETDVPVLLLINKIDLAKGNELQEKMAYWNEHIDAKEIIPISALEGLNTPRVFEAILELLPEHPPYYPKTELTDRPERFFAAEIIREKILMNYKKEVPYSTEVAVIEFKEDDNIIRIRAEIFVERQTQKGIIIGKGGEMLKRVGTQARQEMETFFGKQVYLEQHVKVESDWRKRQSQLNRFGYRG